MSQLCVGVASAADIAGTQVDVCVSFVLGLLLLLTLLAHKLAIESALCWGADSAGGRSPQDREAAGYGE